jgi:8-oxo-dGTP diphosphatase
VVRAAGGVLARPGPNGRTEVAVVHRPAYDDWSFPKGKLHPGESLEAAAIREVAEETGWDAALVRPLGTSEYTDRKGRPKVVTYWLMRPRSGSFAPTAEVDRMLWLPIPEAKDLLAYPHDRELLDTVETVQPTS